MSRSFFRAARRLLQNLDEVLVVRAQQAPELRVQAEPLLSLPSAYLFNSAAKQSLQLKAAAHFSCLHDATTGMLAKAGSLRDRYYLALSAALRQQRAGKWVKDLAAAEFRIVALSNALCGSSPGERLMSLGLAPAVAAWWGLAPSTAHALALDTGQGQLKAHYSLHPSYTVGALVHEAWCQFREELRIALRGAYLLLLFTPAVAMAPLAAWLRWGRVAWLRLVLWTLERAGPAFIKWGQWAATRPDLFAPDLCATLAKLQTGAPAHDYVYTDAALERAFGCPVAELFDNLNPDPVASGSIAQIYRGVLSVRGAAGSSFKPGTVVAVKVRHPGVGVLMQRDFVLMGRAARMCAVLPGLAGMRLDESVRQFGGPLRDQLDLAAEARHLARFNRNFRAWRRVSFPAPVFPLVAPDVLVETFEEGRLISSYVNNPSNRHNVALANLGMDAYLKMLLRDNYIHADLHPGNILVRVVDPNSAWGRVAHFFALPTAPHLVLLDTGMVAELTPQDQRNLVAFFKAITAQDGGALAHNILRFSDGQTCPDPAAFVADMQALFEGLDLETISAYTSQVIGDVLERVRRHQVQLKGVVSTVAVTTLVLEGWSTKLNPDIRIMDTLKEVLPMTWSERLSRTVDRLMSTDFPTNV